MWNEIPTEIFTQVLHNLYGKDEWGRDPAYSDMANYGLVCKDWAEPAQVLIWRHVSGPRSRSFYRTVHNSKQGPTSRVDSLLEQVKVLALYLVADSSTDDTGITQTQLSFLIRACPQLYELQVFVRGVHNLDESFMESLPSSQIYALQVNGCSVQSPMLYSLLDCFPSVQFITLGYEIDISPPARLPRQQFYELALHRTIGREQLAWLLSSSVSTLEVLELRDLPGDDTILILKPHLPYIRALRLIIYNSKCANLIAQCTQLRELTLWNLPSVIPIQSLPSTLEHLAFVGYSFTPGVSLEPIVTLIQHLPNLRIVSCGKQIKEDPTFASLRVMCSQKGVELRPDLNKFWPVSSALLLVFIGTPQTCSGGISNQNSLLPATSLCIQFLPDEE